MPEIVLSRPDRLKLVTALTDAVRTADGIDGVLDDVGLPVGRRPTVAGNPESAWRDAVHELEQGAVPDGIRNLLGVVLIRYPVNGIFGSIARQYAPDVVPDEPEQNEDGQEQPNAGPSRGCRLFVRATSQAERRKIVAMLTDLGFGPSEDFFTNYVVSYTLAESNADAVGEALDRTQLGWTVVPPGDDADYLLSHIVVQGPDGRSIRFSDTPAATRVADIAADTLMMYPDNSARVTVTDRVNEDGVGERLEPEQTLHEAGVRDGDRLRVGYQTNAGSVSPSFRDPALVRAGNQIRQFAEFTEGIGLVANSADLATVFELEFDQESFGPPLPGSEDPTRVVHHVVQIELGEKFPLRSPTVFWLTDIFHPNVWPNYDSEKARQRPGWQGLVCLGELDEAWKPAMDLGLLCQMLIDMAAYRNYSIVEFTGRPAIADGQARDEFRGNAYDGQAALWALRNQDVIAAMGGTPIFQTSEPAPASAYHGFFGFDS